MSMGCKFSDKPKSIIRKGLWSPEEDEKLKSYIFQYGHGCWSSLPTKAGLQRNGKSCRLRWINYLKPGLKRGVFTEAEDETILTLHRSLGNKWSQIAQKLSGRTDNEIKNYWHSYLKKKAIESEEFQSQRNTQIESTSSNSQETTTEVSSLEAVPKLFSYEPSTLPKVLFSEWFSPNHNVPCQSYGYSMNTTASLGDLSDHSRDVDTVYKQAFWDDVVAFGDGMHHEMSSGAAFGEIGQVEIAPASEMYNDLDLYDGDISY